MVAGCTALRHGSPAAACSSCSVGVSQRDGGTASSPGPAAPSMPSRPSTSTTTTSRSSAIALDRRRADPRVARRLSLHRGHLGVRRGRRLLPGQPDAGRRVRLRRGGRARDAVAVDLQPRLGDRVGRLADDRRRRRAARASRWVRGVRTSGRRSRQPGRPTSPVSPRRRTCRQAPTTASRRRARRHTPSRSCTTPSATRSPRRSSPSGQAPRCSSTPTTSGRRSRWPSRSPAPSSERSGSTPATSASWPTRSADNSTASAPTKTRIIVTSDLDEFAIAGLAAAPVDGYGVGTSLVTGSGRPTSGFVYKLVARATDRPADLGVGREEERAQGLHRRPQVGAAAAERRAASPRPRSSESASAPIDDGDDRALLVELVRAGEIVGREPLADRPRPPSPRPSPSSPPRRTSFQRGEPAIPTEYVGT